MKKQSLTPHGDKKTGPHQQSPHEHILNKKGHPKLGKESIAKKIKQHDSGGLA